MPQDKHLHAEPVSRAAPVDPKALQANLKRSIAAEPRLAGLPAQTIIKISDEVQQQALAAVRGGNLKAWTAGHVREAGRLGLMDTREIDALRAVVSATNTAQLQSSIKHAQLLAAPDTLFGEITQTLSTVVFRSDGVQAMGDMGDAAQIVIGAASLGAAIGGAEGAIPGAVIGGVVGAVVAAAALYGDSLMGGGDGDEGEDDGEDDGTDGGGDTGTTEDTGR